MKYLGEKSVAMTRRAKENKCIPKDNFESNFKTCSETQKAMSVKKIRQLSFVSHLQTLLPFYLFLFLALKTRNYLLENPSVRLQLILLLEDLSGP